MTPIELTLERFEQLLDEERDAIREVASAQLSRLAVEKEHLMADLVEAEVTSEPRLAARFERLVRRIRYNLLLLVHARACLMEVVESVRPVAASYHSSRPGIGAMTAASLSVTG